MKVLCIDGGGIRGLIPALVLAEIERRTGRRTAELVDLVAGHVDGRDPRLRAHPPRPRRPARCFSAEELAGIYVEEGPRIFHRGLLKRIFSVGGWIDERYEDDGLERARWSAISATAMAVRGARADRDRHRLRHPRPLRVLLPLRARRAPTRRTTSRSSQVGARDRRPRRATSSPSR